MARSTDGTSSIPSLLRTMWGNYKPDTNSLDSLILALLEIRNKMGNLPVVLQDSLGDYDVVSHPKLQELQFWDIADHNLPPMQEEPPEPKEKNPFVLGKRVVVLKRGSHGHSG